MNKLKKIILKKFENNRSKCNREKKGKINKNPCEKTEKKNMFTHLLRLTVLSVNNCNQQTTITNILNTLNTP